MALWNTSLERSLIIIVAISLVIIATFSLVILFTLNHQKNTKNGGATSLSSSSFSSKSNGKNTLSKVKLLHQTCLTGDCLQASSKILRYMDGNVDPCEDFYEFACGSFEKFTILPDNAELVTIIELTDSKVEEELGEILLTEADPKEPRYVKLLKQYYQACTDKEAIEIHSLETFGSILKEMGGWPVLEGENWDEDQFDWITSAYKAKNLGLPFKQFLSVDVTNYNREKLEILLRTPRHLRLLSKGLNNPELAKQFYGHYLGFMLASVKILGADRNDTEKELEASLQLEIDIYAIMRATYTSTRFLLSVNNLIRRYPSSFPWLEYLNTILAPDRNVTAETLVYCEDPGFIQQLEVLLKKTPKRVQANYFMWRIFLLTNNYLNERISLNTIKYGLYYGERKEFRKRWRECVVDILTKFGVASTALYAKHFIKNGTRENVQKTLQEMRMGFVNATNDFEWIDTGLRLEIVIQLLKGVVIVGFPDEVLDDDRVDEYYSDLEFPENNYFKMYNNLTRFNTRSQFKLLDPSYKSNHSWIEKIPSPYSNFGHDSSSDFTTMFIGTLRPGYFFNSEYPNYLNFGSIGSSIFQGMVSVDYESDVYRNRSQCFYDQYKKYIYMTSFLLAFHLGEQIAINEAYISYASWSKSHEPEPLLPGLKEYSAEQLFWISLANSKCVKTRPRYAQTYNILNVRLTNKDRINNAVKNSKYFAKAFNCAPKSAMNPEEKCEMY